ncbi:MAG TPA: lytic transglycosylase domain-containing protein [Longimicrobiaceae bacterium]|nr:lytic transglycosylase domain-containing protein [Longimicrobiaceae bacterium]
MQNRDEQNGLRPLGVRELLQKRGVRALLATVAVTQVAITVQAVDARKQDAARPAPAASFAASPVLPPVVVSELAMEEPASAVLADAKAKSLARKYKGKGYPVTEQLAMSIVDAALEYGIEPEMAFGLVRAESGFRNSATSHVGAVGLTQLMPRTARWLEPGVTTRDLRDSETNLRIGLGYLRKLLDKYEGNERLALLAYNRGPGTVDRVLKRGGNPDNGYVEKVMAD